MTDKLVDKHPQNTVDDAATSLKQTVEAKHNSSVYGVVQANSINDSTINIHVNNRVDKDELSSINNQNKKLHNSPKQTRFFTGRENELNQVDELFKSNKEVAISGMGGVGKTQTALEFCHLHINSYQTILWINAENESSFNRSYYGVVDLLNLVSGSSTNDAASSAATNDGANQALKVDEVISLVKRWLANNHNWLMVLDNLEDPKLIKDYLPSNHQGHVLITTRSQSLKGYAAIVQLKKMSNETGILFLLKRANLIPIDSSNLDELKADNKIDDVLITDAQKIVQAMDGLPLALEQAGAYIQESACSLADYLKSYEDVRNTATILDNDGEDANDHKSVYATFKLNFDVVKEKSVAAAKLLEVCSFLDSELIPEEIFTSAGNFLGDELAKLQDNTYEFNNCLKLLLGYSLIERDTNNKSLSIHRLVQTVIRELLNEDNKKLLVDSLAKALYSLCPESAQTPNDWPYHQNLLPSVTSFFDFAKLYQSNPVEAAYLFYQFGIYCYKQALFTQSLAFYSLSLDIKKHLFGDYHLDVASTINNIAVVYTQKGNYSQALDFYNQSLDIYKQHSGNYQPFLAMTLNNIGEIHHQQGNYSKALDFFSQSLAIKKQHFGNDHTNVALTLSNIGNIYHSQGNYPQALDLHNQSLAIYKQHFGDYHPDVASVLNNIGNIYHSQGNYPQALDLHNQSLDIKKHHFGGYHPNVATALLDIAIVYYSQGNYSQALDLYNQALTINKHYFGDFHPSVASILNNVGDFYQDQGQHSQALSCYKEALIIYRNSFGDKHIKTAIVLQSIGQIYIKQNQLQKAVHYLQEALTITKDCLGDNHPNIASIIGNIALTHKQQGNYHDALKYYFQSLAIYKHYFGDNHLNVAISLSSIAVVYSLQGKYTESSEYYYQALSIKKHLFDDNHPSVATTLANIAILYQSINKEVEAIDYYKQALEIFDKFLPTTHPWIAQLLNQYSQLLLKLNRTDEAQPLLDRLASLQQSP